MTNGDPRETMLLALARELPGGPLARRRILTELADHIEDAVDDLCRSGLSRDEAVREAVGRLGDAETIAHTFGVTRTRSHRLSRLRVRHSLAWMMVAAMSVVTVVAAELPQASGAKPRAALFAPATPRVASAERSRVTRPTLPPPTHRRIAERR